jgi:hypothetical protein
MPDPERLYDADGNVYKQDIGRGYVPSREGGLWPERDVGLLGPNIERDAGGGPKVARDWAQRPYVARDGRPLFVPRMPGGSPGGSVESFSAWVAMLVIWIVIAVACVGLWVCWRFLASLTADIRERRLTISTLAWGTPVVIVAIWALVSVLTPRHSSYRGSTSGGTSAQAGQGTAATVLRGPSAYLELAIPDRIADTCATGDRSDVVGSLAARDCFPEGGVLHQVSVYLMTPEGARRAFTDRMRQQGHTSDRRGGSPTDCFGGTEGMERTARRSLGCFIDKQGHASIRGADTEACPAFYWAAYSAGPDTAAAMKEARALLAGLGDDMGRVRLLRGCE